MRAILYSLVRGSLFVLALVVIVVTVGGGIRYLSTDREEGEALVVDAANLIPAAERSWLAVYLWFQGDAIETPLGSLALDRDAATFLTQQASCLSLNYGPHAGEHSAENQLPFLQVAAPGIPAVVCLVGDHADATLDGIVNALVRLNERRRVLVLASTDLLHDPEYERVTYTDRQTMSQVEAVDHEAIMKRWSYAEQVCCGIGPVVCAMRFAKRLGVTAGTVLHYRNSGDDFPESRGSWVVGYGSAVFVERE